MAAVKTACKVTRKQFREQAKDLAVVIDGKHLIAEVKEFATGSLGWNANQKLVVSVGGTLVTVQVGLNLTIVGSKELPPS